VQVVRRDAPGQLVGLAERLVRAVGYSGPGSVQFIERDGHFFVHDVNLRLPATVALTIAAGLDLPRLSVDAALGRAPDLSGLRIRYGATYLWLGGELRAVLAARPAGRRATGLLGLAFETLRGLVEPTHVVDLPARDGLLRRHG
jgi:predicted ATP-grasp superfamily ATP-dependent carboligase